MMELKRECMDLQNLCREIRNKFGDEFMDDMSYRFRDPEWNTPCDRIEWGMKRELLDLGYVIREVSVVCPDDSLDFMTSYTIESDL